MKLDGRRSSLELGPKRKKRSETSVRHMSANLERYAAISLKSRTIGGHFGGDLYFATLGGRNRIFSSGLRPI